MTFSEICINSMQNLQGPNIEPNHMLLIVTTYDIYLDFTSLGHYSLDVCYTYDCQCHGLCSNVKTTPN